MTALVVLAGPEQKGEGAPNERRRGKKKKCGLRDVDFSARSELGQVAEARRPGGGRGLLSMGGKVQG